MWIIIVRLDISSIRFSVLYCKIELEQTGNQQQSLWMPDNYQWVVNAFCVWSRKGSIHYNITGAVVQEFISQPFAIYLINNDVSQWAKNVSLASHHGSEQDPVRAENELGAWRDPRLEPNLVANGLTNLQRKILLNYWA